MKFHTTLLLMLASAALFTAQAQQLVVNDQLYTPPQLVTDVLLGAGITVSNVTYTGGSSQIAYFSNGDSLGMQRGVLLTTGDANGAVGPNNSADYSNIVGTPGDTMLETYLGGGASTYDACVLEFDMVTSMDEISLRYLFASEEYPEFVCTPYNDAFAFFVTGAGYAPNTNVALIPATSTPVAINSVNGGTVGAYGTLPDCISLNNASLYVTNPEHVTQYDGYTVPLTARISVVPNTTYHIRLVVADVVDEVLDSGIFLEAGGLTTDATRVDVTICSGDSAFAGGAWQTTAGTYVDTFTAASGSDSLVFTQLTVTTITTNVSFTLCLGDSIFFANAWYTQPGIYDDTFTTALGCDSVVTMQLSFDTVAASNMSATICSGDSVLAAGAWRTDAGVYIDTLVASGGCDSLVTWQVTVIPPVSFHLVSSRCPGDSAFLAGAWQTIAGDYYDTLVASDGCDSVNITTLIFTTTVGSNISDTICLGDSIFAGGAWQTAAGLYFDTLPSTRGCDSIITTAVAVEGDGVWPGDANDDGIANNTDLLAIGLYFGETGIARDSLSYHWQAHCADDWNSTQNNGANKKHADCNGDGVVGRTDTLALNINYMLTHPKGGSPKGAGAALMLAPRQSVYYPGDTVLLDVVPGDNAAPVSSLYGIAFSIGFDASIAEPGSVSFQFADSWLGSMSANLAFSKVFEANGRVDCAVTRTDHQNASGHGSIGVLSFIASDAVNTVQTSTISILDYEAVENSGSEVPFDAEETTLTVDGTIGIKNHSLATGFSVYPNPFTAAATVEFSLKQDAQVTLRVYDVLGKVVFEKAASQYGQGNHKLQFEPNTSAKGVLFAELTVDGVKLRKRVVRY